VSAVTTARHRAVTWRGQLFGTWGNTVSTVVVAALAGWLAWRLLSWAVIDAVFVADAAACRADERVGACWGVVAEKGRAIVFGRYPYEAQWRPLVGLLLFTLATLAASMPRFWRPAMVGVWLLAFAVFVLLMRGGVAGLSHVPTTRWGGLPLTVLLSVASLAMAFPLGVALALARRSSWPVMRGASTLYIEVVRGVPLISILFMASFVLPLMLPQQARLDVLLRVVIGFTLFAAAYLAEVVRGGLQAVPAGQIAAARAIGLDSLQVQRDVVLPQALRASLPALMNSVIGTFKDSSLVVVVSLYELTGALTLALGGDPTWRPFYLEGYLFIAFIYATACLAMSRYSRWLERRLGTARTIPQEPA
jgi:general L-amino acid transport system permease protein